MNSLQKYLLAFGILLVFFGVAQAAAPIVYKSSIKVDNWLTSGGMPAFGYFRDGNLTVDFNVLDPDVNGGVGKLDANIDLRRIDTNASVRIITDLNLAAVANPTSTSGTYCNDANFARGTGPGDFNIGSTCHFDVNISAQWVFDLNISNDINHLALWGTAVFSAADKNWVIDINVTDTAGTDRNAMTNDRNFEVDNNAPVIADVNVTYSPGTNINDKNGYTNDTTPTFVISATDANSFAFSCSGLAYNDYNVYATSFALFDLKTGDGCLNQDGNKGVYVRFKDAAGNMADDNTLGGGASPILRAGGIFIDTIKPLGVRRDGNNSVWQGFDANVNLWCIDQNSDGNGSGCYRINYRVDSNAMANDQNTNLGARVSVYDGNTGFPRFKSAHDTRAFGDLNVIFQTDGNYQMDFNAHDQAGNISDMNFFFVTVDKTVPVWNTDFNVDINSEFVGAGGTGLDFNTFIDRFVKPYQNFRVRATSMIDVNMSATYISLYSNKAPLTDVNIIYTDINAGRIFSPIASLLLSSPVKGDMNIDANKAGNSGTWFYDFNAGSFDANFVPKNIRVKVRDAAGNWSADTNITQFPLIFYNFGWPGQGLDANAIIDRNQGSTNFLTDVNNFADANLTFTKSGYGQLRLYDVNISTQALAAKLANLSTAIVATKSDSNANGLKAGDVNIGIDLSVFSDLNVSAKLTVQKIPYSTEPGIRKGDSNCGTYCYQTNYFLDLDGKGILDFNVYGFSTYTTDKTQPAWTNTTQATTTINATSHLLSGTTDENATCKYDTNNTTYASMSGVFTPSSRGLTQTATLTFNTGSETLVYYVRCVDSVGNAMVDSNSLSFIKQTGGGGGTPPTCTLPQVLNTQTNTCYTPTIPPTTPPTCTLPQVLNTQTNTCYTPTIPPTTPPAPVVETIVPATTVSAVPPTTEAVQAAITEASATGVTSTQVLANNAKVETALKFEVTKTTTTPSGGGTPVVAYSSKLTLSFKNTTSDKLKNVKFLQVIPKSIAESASQIVVPAGVKYRIVKDDPILEFTIDEVGVGKTASVNFSVAKQLDTATVQQMQKPLVMELKAEAPAPEEEQITTPAPKPKPAAKPPATTAKKPAAPQDMTWTWAAIAVVIIIIAAYFVVKQKKKR